MLLTGLTASLAEAWHVCDAAVYQAEAVQHLHFANNAVRIGVLGSI